MWVHSMHPGAHTHTHTVFRGWDLYNLVLQCFWYVGAGWGWASVADVASSQGRAEETAQHCSPAAAHCTQNMGNWKIYHSEKDWLHWLAVDQRVVLGCTKRCRSLQFSRWLLQWPQWRRSAVTKIDVSDQSCRHEKHRQECRFMEHDSLILLAAVTLSAHMAPETWLDLNERCHT